GGTAAGLLGLRRRLARRGGARARGPRGDPPRGARARRHEGRAAAGTAARARRAPRRPRPARGARALPADRGGAAGPRARACGTRRGRSGARCLLERGGRTSRGPRVVERAMRAGLMLLAAAVALSGCAAGSARVAAPPQRELGVPGARLWLSYPAGWSAEAQPVIDVRGSSAERLRVGSFRPPEGPRDHPHARLP